MKRNVLTCIIMMLMYPYVICNIVTLHNSLVVSFTHYRLLVSFFQAFTDIHNIQIGYPVINEFESICQTPPFTYKSLPIGVVPEIVGTLRNLNGSVVGLWHNTNNCYVVPYSHHTTCTRYSFSNRLSECDNDIRLQLNARKAGFRVIQDLQDIRVLIEKLLDNFFQIQALDKRKVILSGAPKSALLRQIQSNINTFLIQSETYMNKINSYVLQDLQFVEEFQQEFSIDIQILRDSVDKGSALICSLIRGIFNQSQVDEMAEFLAYDLFSNLTNNSSDVETNSWFVALQLKRVTYHSIVVSMSNLIYQVNNYQLSNGSCQTECQTPNSRELFHFEILDFLQNVTKFNSDRISQCGTTIIEKTKGIVTQISQAKLTELDYSLPFQWHKCLSQQALSQSPSFSLDLSGMSSIPFSRSTVINSEQGHPGLLFLPRTSIAYVHHDTFTRVIDLLQLSFNPLVETNSEFVETLYLPDPQPGIIPPPSVTPLFQCPPGRYGKDCSRCPIGSWSNDGYLHLCSNAPAADAEYFMDNWPTPDCPFLCLNNKYRVNNTCQTPSEGYYPLSNQYQIGRCQTEYPSKFVAYLSHGNTGKPFSCSTWAHHALEMEYNISNILVESFSIEIWLKLNISDFKRACDPQQCDQIRFGILDTELWSLYLSFHEHKVRLSVTDDVGASAQSNVFSLDGDWHQYVIQYDSQLKLIYFIIDSVPVGGGWYNSPKRINNDTLIIGGIRSEYPLRSRILPGQIAEIHIRPSIFPMEAFPVDISSVTKTCEEDQYWLAHKCVPLCMLEGLTNTDDCPCTWGQFLNDRTNQCSWCPSSSLGSKFPHYYESDCICGSGYIWNNSTRSCVVGKPSLVEPDVDYFYDPIPEVVTSNSNEGIVIPLNATLVVHPPSQNEALQSLRAILQTTNDIILEITILSGLSVVVTERVPFVDLPFQYSFFHVGHFRIEAQFNKPGHLLGTRYSQSVVVQARALPPFIRPFDQKLNGTTLFKIATQEPSENRVYHSFDGITFKIYDKRNPPAASPPVSVYMYTKSQMPNVLPSQLVTTNFIWNTESEDYKLALSLERANPERNTTKNNTRTVAFLVWCQKSIPNCILAFVIPVVSLVIISLGIILLLVVVRIIIKRKRKRGVHKRNYSSIKMEKKRKRKKRGLRDENRTSPESRLYGDIICSIDYCSKLAQFHCCDCRQYLCKLCRNNHPRDHQLMRIMICDTCRRKSEKLIRQKNNRFKYVCPHCVSSDPLTSSIQVIHACIQCKDEQIFSKESQYLCRNCILLSKLDVQQ